MTDLIKRLRDRIVEVYGGHGTVLEYPDDLCQEAAAALERAYAEPTMEEAAKVWSIITGRDGPSMEQMQSTIAVLAAFIARRRES